MATINEKILNGLNAYTPALKEHLEEIFVSQEEGKVLTDENFTAEDKAKLEGIKAGAEVNVIEKISVDGAEVAVNSDTKTASITLPNNFTDADRTKLDGITAGAQPNVIESISFDAGSVTVDPTTKEAAITQATKFTDDEKTKLAGIADGAEVNVIESISVDGVNASIDSSKKASVTLSKATTDNLDNNTEDLATAAFVNAIIRRLVGNAPDALDTLGELAAALNNDENAVANLTTQIGQKQPKSDLLTSIAGLTTSADKMIYTTAKDKAATTSITSYGRELINLANVAALKSSLGTFTDDTKQPKSDALTSIAGLTTAANKMIYTTASNKYAVATLTAYARTLLSQSDRAALLKLLNRVCDSNFDECGKTWSFLGNPVLTAKNPKFKNGTIHFDGGSAIYTDSSYSLGGSTNFTVDFFFTPDAISLDTDNTNKLKLFNANATDNADSLFYIDLWAGKPHVSAGFPWTSATFDLTGPDVLIAHKTYHFALSYQDGKTWNFYLDGSLIGTYDLAMPTKNFIFTLGARYIPSLGTAQAFAFGSMVEFRFQKNTSALTTSFTVPSSAYTKNSNTISLLHFNA